ncbi:STAS domain-containing protein [Erythrobacter sp. A6_0]|jgi:anti-anti-sigma regulatory factor|uniref:STAS domain-containing protein n=1 Tax=Erythrobacter sp. A6_0 TaxID=2821089 RepID=UPI001ADD2D8A|nr:STAS domain-containing protein [Erythrobacter sp. A6_0]MBO9511521.1 STAS domain-containing protein [Erythrobacter sp. A6_0]|tara:strand:- start:172 stop:432 length:261 start_codon:yes stop_codon:yes gene_type:complete
MIELPAVINAAEAERIAEALLERINAKDRIAIDASNVERIGLAGLQVLLAGRNTATDAGLAFAIEGFSDPLSDMANLAGVDGPILH